MVKRVVLGLLATLLFPYPADACSCAPLSPCHTFWMADTVFIGRAQSVVEKTRGNQVTRLVVEEWLRGERVGAEVTTTRMEWAVRATSVSSRASSISSMRAGEPMPAGAYSVWRDGFD